MTGNVTSAFQVAATHGNGFSVFFLGPNFVTFRVTGNGAITAGAVTIECCPGNMIGVPESGTGTWTALTTITVQANSTVDYQAGIVSGTFRTRISTPVTGGTVTVLGIRPEREQKGWSRRPSPLASSSG
jgi:hypothetical protein